MFKPSRHLRAVAMLGVAAALAVGGVAVAQDDSPGQGSSKGNGARPAGPPPGGPGMLPKGLTYAQFHVLKKNGEAEVIRLDQGKITAIDAGSVTLEANDGSSVTVALDADTEVITGPDDHDAAVDDLSVGQQVSVCGPEGEAAKSIMAAPKKPPMKG
jgi:hypothetical protein